MVDLRPKTTQGLRTPVLGHESPSPRKKSNNPLSKHVPALSNASSSSQSPPLPIHFLPTPLSTSAAPSITASASAASAAASAAGYSPTTLAPPGHFPPAFKSSYGYSREQGGSGENGYNYGQGDKKGKGKVLGYEGSVPLNDTFEYRQAVLASGRESGEAVSPYAQYGQDGTSYPYPYQYPYASRTGLIPNGQGQGHKRATSDAAGTTFSCPADLEFSARYTLDHSPVDGNGGVFPSHFDKISTPGPNETSGSGARGYEPTDIDSAPDLAPLSGLKGDNGAYTPRSPYRPGEYTRRSARTAAQSDRTRLGLERRLFSGSVSARGRQDEGDDDEQEQEQEQPKRNRGSSPLQPPFEARLILRAGASVDLISWLRKNFHYIPSAAHSVLTPSTSLLAIRALIAERFPRLPEPPELIKAVTVAFPRSQWDYPSNESEPPMIRGLVWNGKELDVYDEVSDEDADGEVDSRAIKTPDKNGKGRKKNGAEAQYWRDHHAQMKNKRNVEAAAAAANAAASSAPITRNAARSSLAAEAHAASRTRLSGSGIKPSSPPPSSFESPSSSSKSKRPGNGNAPATPARSVLDDFAELATLADKTPKSTAMSLPADGGVLNGVTASAPGMQQRTGGQGSMVPPAPAYALANICNSFDGSRVSRAGGFGGAIVASTSRGKKRKSAAAEPDTDTGRRMSRGRANRDASPDRLSDLLAAAQAVDGQTDGPQPTPGFDQAPAPTFMRRESSGSGHKRRRTIGGMGPGMREMLDINHPPPAWAHRPYGGLFGPPLHSRSGQYASRDNASYWPGPTGAAPHSQAGSISPWARQLASLPELATPKKDKSSTGPNGRGKKEDGVHSPPASEVEAAVRSGKDTASVMTLASASQASLAAGTVAPETTIAAGSKASGSSSKGQKKKSSVQATSQSGHGTMPAPSSVPVHSTSTPSSTSLPLPAKPRARKANELPTEGDAPGIDCKPPYPYHEMIRHAIQEAPDCRLQLSQIYSNIADRFPFFKTLDEKKTAGWQNSIRHNLSLKKMFVRVGKMDGLPDEGGKGGWWTVKMGVPDEGRPGRKGKSKRKSDADESESGGNGEQSEAGPAEQALQPMDTGSTRQEAQILETALGGGAGGSAI